MEKAKVLIVDDEEDICRSLKLFLESENCLVYTAGDVDQAKKIIESHKIDVVVTDIILPGETGVELLSILRKKHPEIQIIMMTGEPTIDTASEAVRQGAFDYLTKPIDGDDLVGVVAKAYKIKALAEENERLTNENAQYRYHLEKLVAERTEELRLSRENYRNLIEGLPVLVFEVDFESQKPIYIGGSLLLKLGIASEELYQKGRWVKMLHPDDRAQILSRLSQAAKNPKPTVRTQFRLLTTNGETVWVEHIPNSVIENGRLVRLRGILVDISERKIAEQTQKELREELLAVREQNENILLTNLEFGTARSSVAKKRDVKTKEPEPFFGSNPEMIKVRQLVIFATEHNEPVLFTGETGTGKGLLAKTIHLRSELRDKPFVSLNCSSLKGDLLESELFGHARGAFTSAVKERKGLLEEANNGTLFLDEIGDMELKAQSSLLKVLEEKTYRRLGEVKVRRSNFRLVCATNRNLAQEVEIGRFRKDLFYRINVFPITIPPLRNRIEDLQELVGYLLEALGMDHLILSDQTTALIRNYFWPGNIRELRNALIRAALLARDSEILPEHFPALQTFDSDNAVIKENRQPTGINEIQTEEQTIRRLLKNYDNNRSKVARQLGFSRNTLYRRLKKYQID
jgi:two-component system, NtrC family, response regulator HydG